MPNTKTPSPILTLDNITYMLFRRKWFILLGLFLGLVAGTATYFLTPPQFVSKAKLLVLYVSDSLDPTAEDGIVRRPDSRGGNIMNSEMQIISSRSIAEEVVKKIGAASIFPPQEGKPAPNDAAAAVAVLGGLSIDVPRNSNIIRLSYTGQSPEIAQRVLDGLIKEYLAASKEIHSAAASYDYFTQKTDQLRSDLRAVEEELQQVKSDLGIVSLDTSLASLAERVEGIREGMQHQHGVIASAKARVQLLEEQLGEVSRPITTDATAEATATDPLAEFERQWALDQIASLRERERSLLSSYTSRSAPVLNIQRQIADAEQKAGLESRSVSSVALFAADQSGDVLRQDLVKERANVASATALLNVLIQQEDQTRQEIRELSSNENRIVELIRQREVLDRAYRQFADALDMAKNQLALAPEQLSNITEVEPATLPLKPNTADLKKRVATAGVLGVAIPVGIAFLLELLAGRSLRKSVDIERALDVPTLITFPSASGFRHPFTLDGSTKLLTSPGAEGAEQEGEERTFNDSVASYFSALRHKIQGSGVTDGEIPHLIGVTSCTEGAGVTTVSAGLALAMSEQEGEKVLLIDGDMGHGNAHKVLGVQSASSLPEVMLDGGHSSRVQKGLYFLSSGNGEHRKVQSSLGRRFRDVVSFLKTARYTNVILDLPPVAETSPTLQMAGLLDGVILVVESEKVSRERARAALKMLHDANANVVGVVFNKKKDYVPAWLDGG